MNEHDGDYREKSGSDGCFGYYLTKRNFRDGTEGDGVLPCLRSASWKGGDTMRSAAGREAEGSFPLPAGRRCGGFHARIRLSPWWDSDVFGDASFKGN